MTHTALARTKVEGTRLASYAQLKRKVEEALLLGQRRVEQEKIRTYWQTGKIISGYLSTYKNRNPLFLRKSFILNDLLYCFYIKSILQYEK